MPVEPHETLEGQIIDEKNVKAFAVKACNKVGIVADLSVLDFNAPISMETVNYEYLATNGEKRNYSGKRFVFQSDVVSLGNVDVGKESEAKIFSIGDNQLSFRLQGSTSAKQFGVSEIFKKLGSQPVGISRLEIDPCQAKMELSLLPGLKLQMEIRNKRCKMIENMHKKNSDLQSSIEASSELKGALLSFEQSKWKNLDIEQKKELKDIDQAFQFVYENAPDFCNAKDEHESLLQDEIGIITEQVGKMLKNCDKCQRVKFHNLESIISSGQILSQTEGVRTSNGTYDPEMRREFSIHQYGRNMNEKYGYACLFSEEVNGKREGSINIYGNIILRFKPESVEDKITYFLGDTLAAKKYNFDTRPGVVGTENRETSLSASMHLNNQQILEVAKNGSMDPYDYVGERNYLEIQILGSLSLDDVSSIAFLEHEDYNNLSDDMKDILRKKEIELVFPSATKETEESV